jgi:spermidine synthase
MQAQAPRKERRARERAERKVERHPAWIVPALAVVFLVSGSAGLVHEVVWARMLGKVFGASSLAVSTVLAAFMGGLALGSWWIGRRVDDLRDRRRTYALLEIGIGVAALAVPLLLHLVEPLYGALWRRFHLSFGVFSVLRFVIAGALLLPPTVMMGATLPVLADYLAGLRERPIAPQWLYTVNLAGAVIGVALAGFVLMPAIGMWGTIIVGAVINITAGLVVLGMPEIPAPAAPVRAAATAPLPRPPVLLTVAALVSGAASIATQVAWTRVLVLIVGSTTYAFSTVVLVYLIALAVGSAWAARRASAATDVRPLLAGTHLVMAVAMLAAVWAVNRLPYWYLGLFQSWQPEGIAGLVGMNMVIVFVILFPSVLFAGTVLPLAMIGALPPQARGTGAVVGGIYAVNTVGAILGALLGGFVLLPLIGSQAILLGVALVGAALGVAFAANSPGPRWLMPVALGVAGVVVAGTVARPDWRTQELNAAVFEPSRLSADGIADPDEKLLYYREGPTATVMVGDRDGQIALRINGRVNASDGAIDMPTQVLLAQVPLILAPRTEDVFILGWGSGITAGSALQGPVEHVTAVELEPAVVESSRFFDHVNHQPLSDPRLRLFQDDARHILLAAHDTYDVMISEPSHPWVTGVASLFTRDFFALAAARLREDGVFAQWLQGYQIPLESFRSILAAFQSVFPEVNIYSPSDADDWILVGSRRPLKVDLAGLERRWAHDGTRSEMARVGMERPEHLLAGFYLGTEQVRAITAGVRVNTDDNMHVEFSAPRQIAEPRGVSGTRLATFLADHIVPAEQALTDPQTLLDDPVRVRALVAGLERQARDIEPYEELVGDTQ